MAGKKRHPQYTAPSQGAIILKLKYLFFLTAGALYANDWTMEFRAGAFIPSSHHIQKVFGRAWIEGESEFTYEFAPSWRSWGNVGYFYKNGHRHRDHIQVYNFSAGLKYVLETPHVKPYLGLGPVYTFFHVKNDPQFNWQRVYKNQWGLVAKSGLYIDLTKTVFLDLFFDYTYQPIHFRSTNTHISGFRTGIGLGFSF